MAQYQLPAATSVVDFLNSQGKDSSFGSRSKMYSTAGIDKRLGAFTGSSSQNLALLDYLKSQGKPPAPTPSGASSVVTTAKTTTPQMTTPAGAFSVLQSVKPPNPGPVNFDAITMANKAPLPPGLAAPQPVTSIDFSKINVTPPPTPSDPAQRALGAIAPSAPAAPTAQGTAAQPPATETITDTSITFGGTPPSSDGERDLVAEFMNSAEGMALLDKYERGEIDDTAAAAEQKRLLEDKYASERSTLENNLAKSGLAFSGIRNTQLKALADNLAASELDVDRKLASKLLDSNANLRDGIMKGVEDLIKKAADKDKEAIQQLNAVGLAVVNGQLVPTLAARNAEAAERNRVIDNARAQAQFELQERRLQLAEESAARAEARFAQIYGAGRGEDFALLRAAMEAAPGASQQELLAWALENTGLSSTEANAVLATQPITPNQMTSVAKSLVGSLFPENAGKGLLKTVRGDFNDAKEQAKQTLKASGGTLKVNGRVVTLTADDLATLDAIIDTVTREEAEAARAATK